MVATLDAIMGALANLCIGQGKSACKISCHSATVAGGIDQQMDIQACYMRKYIDTEYLSSHNLGCTTWLKTHHDMYAI